MADQATIKTYGNLDLPEGTEDRPLVTFALFAYNQEKYIREAVEGAFAQTYSPLEIILSDDCSSDRTFEIMEEMAQSYKGVHKIVLHRLHENLGRKAFGRRVWSLLSMSRGALIVLAGGDDISSANRTKTIFYEWNKTGNQPVCIYSKVDIINEKNAILQENVGNGDICKFSVRDILEKDGRGLLGASSAFDRRIIDRFGPLSECILLEDGALALRAKLERGIIFISESLVKYRRHADNLTNQREIDSKENLDKYTSGIVWQHIGFMNDYMKKNGKLEYEVAQCVFNRIKRANRISFMFSRNPALRFIAVLSYSDNMSLKRRIWLLLYMFKIVKLK